MSDAELALLLANARRLEREQWIAVLEHEQFNEHQGATEHERGYRAGWSHSHRSVVERMRAKR